MSQFFRNSHADGIDLDLSATRIPMSSTWLGYAGLQLNVQLDKPGKQHGHLKLPLVTHTDAPRQLSIPVCVIKGDNPGPTVTLLAGIHGDELEGSITIHRLARELSASEVYGCLILLPCINLAAHQTGQRCNPADGINIDLAFPGDEHGSPSECLTHEITQRFIKPSDVVVDLRSGGRHLKFIPSVAVRFKHDKRKDTSAEEAMIAFGAPNSLRLPASARHSCLQGMVRAMDKDYIQAELGGGGFYDIQTLSMAHAGCLNILRHLGMLRDDLTLASTRLLEVRDDSYYVFAPDDGVFEPLAYLGENVWQDTPMANLVSLANTANQPRSISAPRDATLIATHPGGFVKAGDLIAILAEEVQA